MAKTTSGRKPEPGSIEERIVAFAEQVGWMAGLTKAKADEMFDRERLIDQLTHIRDEAAALLARLQAERATPAVQSSMPPGKTASAVRAPGKHHRPPVPRERGVKHSHQEIAKAKMASTLRRRGRG